MDSFAGYVNKVMFTLNPSVYLFVYLSIHSPSIFLSYLQVYFGTHHSRLYLCANLIGPGCGTGMSWLIKKSAVDNEGGLKVFSEYLAEDFFIVKALKTRYSCYCL